MLDESLAHPLTIISTPAGLGALIALRFAKMQLSVMALIGIIKTNGIPWADFALEQERTHGFAADRGARGRARARPARLDDDLRHPPRCRAAGDCRRARRGAARPLGIAIIGGLPVSQVLSLYTTGIIYVLLDKLLRRLWGSFVPVARRTPAQ